MLVLNTKEYQNQESLLELCEKIRSWTDHYLQFTITISMGAIVEWIDEVSGSYESAMEGLRYKSVLGSNRLIKPSDISTKPADRTYKHLQTVRSLVQSFRTHDQGWNSLFQGLMSELQTHLYSREEIGNLMDYIVYLLHKDFSQLAPEWVELWTNEFEPRLTRIVEHFDTLDEIEEVFHSVLTELAAKLSDMREQRHSFKFVSTVKEYIDHQYANPELSLTHLSEEFGISPNHISRLFKEELGDNFLDYLIKIRMEQAKSLLLSTDQSIQDIAALVGYVHAISFIRIFKKTTGLTPGAYRQNSGE
jgi:two-component system response regulator YesN